MSTKSAKRTPATGKTRSATPAETPQVEKPTPAVASPVSPTRLSRMQERNELINLNDRLAQYIETVKNLETENDQLCRQIEYAEETVTRESSTVKVFYEKELDALRKALDKANKEKAEFQMKAQGIEDELKDLKFRFGKKERDLTITEKNVINLENQFTEIQTKMNQCVADLKKREKEAKELKLEKDKFSTECHSLKIELEKETLERISLADEVKSLKDSLNFKDQLYQEQLVETRTTRSRIESEIKHQLQQQHEQHLVHSVTELRNQFLLDIEAQRNEYEEKNKAELSNAIERASDYAKQAQCLREDLALKNSHTESLVMRISSLESELNAVNLKIKELEDRINIERQVHARKMTEKDDQINDLRNRLEQQLADYHDLMDVKLSLDFEIATYRKLLEGEESRLNMSKESSRLSADRQSTPVRRTPIRAKRKRGFFSEQQKSSSEYTSSATCKGDVEIYEQDIDGKYVKLFNKSDKDYSLGGWQLIRRADENNETKHKFHRSHIIKAKDYATIWSADAGEMNEPPTNYVLKSQRWFTGDNVKTILLTEEGDEIACRETVRSVHSSSITHSSDGTLVENEDQRCAIM